MADVGLSTKFAGNVQPSCSTDECLQIVQKFSGILKSKAEGGAFSNEEEGCKYVDNLSDSDNEFWDDILRIRDKDDEKFDLVKEVDGRGTFENLVAKCGLYESNEDQRSVKPECSESSPIEEEYSKTLEDFLKEQSYIDLKNKAVSTEINEAENKTVAISQPKSSTDHNVESTADDIGDGSFVQNTVSLVKRKASFVGDHVLISTSNGSIPRGIPLPTIYNSLVGTGNSPVDSNASLTIYNRSAPRNNGSFANPQVSQSPDQSITPTLPEPPDLLHYTISPALKEALAVKISMQGNNASQVRPRPQGQAGKNWITDTSSGRHHPYQISLPNLDVFKS